jgi:hypothetical protein
MVTTRTPMAFMMVAMLGTTPAIMMDTRGSRAGTSDPYVISHPRSRIEGHLFCVRSPLASGATPL